MRTRLTEMLGIEQPMTRAGMGGVAYADMVVAVSEAGGFGCLTGTIQISFLRQR
jgi:enoyl-[acyl-carrier protein] reductase II